MSYELSNREWGLVRASVKMTIHLLEQSNKNHELRHEYEELMKKMKNHELRHEYEELMKKMKV
jgi:hypothetical protein